MLKDKGHPCLPGTGNATPLEKSHIVKLLEVKIPDSSSAARRAAPLSSVLSQILEATNAGPSAPSPNERLRGGSKLLDCQPI